MPEETQQFEFWFFYFAFFQPIRAVTDVNKPDVDGDKETFAIAVLVSFPVCSPRRSVSSRRRPPGRPPFSLQIFCFSVKFVYFVRNVLSGRVSTPLHSRGNARLFELFIFLE